MYNSATIIGNLGKDPETRYTQGGDAVTNISVATSESWKNKQGEKVEKTEWHKVVAFGRLAEIMGEYLKKGKTVMIRGRIETQKWTDKEGVDRYTTQIVADTMKMLGGGGGRESSEGGGEERTTRAPASKSASSQNDLDDDIPF